VKNVVQATLWQAILIGKHAENVVSRIFINPTQTMSSLYK